MKKYINILKKLGFDKTKIQILSKIFVIIITLSLLPTQITKASNADVTSSNSNIVYNSKSTGLLKLSDNTIEIKKTESNVDKEIREKLEKDALTKRSVISREYRSKTINDPDLSTKRDLVKQAAKAFNIDWKILEAVWQIESGKSWDTSVKSYAGAQGPMQFMPATFKHYSIDGNGDGVKDIYNATDAVYSGANYLAKSGLDQGKVDQALFNYNHANWYVQKVKNIANSIEE